MVNGLRIRPKRFIDSSMAPPFQSVANGKRTWNDVLPGSDPARVPSRRRRVGGEKWLENAVSDPRRYSRAIGPNLNQNAAKLGCDPHQQFAASVHGVYRIVL